jgi:hypothetical protein
MIMMRMINDDDDDDFCRKKLEIDVLYFCLVKCASLIKAFNKYK